MSTWVTIPCHRPYLEDLKRCLQSLRGQVDPLNVLVVATCDEPITSRECGGDVRVLRYHGEWNISRWWNLGLDFAAAEERGHDHEVLVLNADAYLAPNAVGRLHNELRRRHVAITTPDVYGVGRNVNYKLEPLSKLLSMPGCCFMVAGELDLRCDVRFKGWYNDDDLDWQGRRAGGVATVPEAVVYHLPAGRGGGAQFAEEGLELFRQKWGSDPWI